jgi:hypothetical protein
VEFLTLHELSLRLDVSVRVLRRRLKQLLLEGTLHDGRDCRRDGYVDETHFVWLVNPDAFMHATELRPVNPVAQVATPPATHLPAPVTHAGHQGDKTLPNVDSPEPGIEREMIDLLKGQMRVKDGQIADLSEQNKKLNDLNFRLNGQLVQHSERIQTLLQLTKGRIDLAEVATPTGNPDPTSVSQSDTQRRPFDHPAGGTEGGQGSDRLAA